MVVESAAPPAPTKSRSGIRLSAAERRASVIAAAVHEFAKGGYAGTSSETIAQRAGISQPYLFRLFTNKRQLFLAAVGKGFDEVRSLFERAAEGLGGLEALDAMGKSYSAYLTNQDLLLLQMHAYAASADPEIRDYVAGRMTELINWVSDRTGGRTSEELRDFFGIGMLCNVVAALGLQDLRIWEGMDCGPLDSSVT